MNILVTSAGRRVKIVEYFKKTLESINGRVITIDCDSNAPALYFADNFEIVSRIDSPNYINEILDICLKYNVDGIVSLIDPELELLARNIDVFNEHDIDLVLSPAEIVEIAFDKYESYRYLLDKGIPSVPTYKNIIEVKDLLNNDQLSYPLIVKPAKGSASIGLFNVSNEIELIEAFNKFEGQIIQPFYKDKEFGVDVYIDMISGELVDLFIKEKINMRSGETDKSVSVHNSKIEQLIKEMIKVTNFRGPIDVDCFEYNGEYYISEINPRFGGGYPHAYELGCDFMTYIVNNLQSEPNNKYSTFKYNSNLEMMKYDNVIIKEFNSLK